MNSADYFVWKWARVPNAISVEDVQNLDDTDRFVDGEPWGSAFPPDVTFQLNSERRKDTVATDNVSNVDLFALVSTPLKEFVEKWPVQSVEFLPVTILDHKGKPLPQRYFIVHPFHDLECLDVAASGVQFSQIRKESMTRVKRLVFDPKFEDPKRDLFRIKNFPDLVLVSRPLAEALQAKKFSALRFIPATDYDGEA